MLATVAMGLFVQVLYRHMLHSEQVKLSFIFSDIDDCLDNNGGCINADCMDLDGGFLCLCLGGFVHANLSDLQSPCSKL